MNLTGVTAIRIPEGNVKSISVGGHVLWQKPDTEPYTELAYIESTGTQYIDTGHVPGVNDVYKIRYAHTTIADNQVVFGSRSSGTYATSKNQVYLNKSSASSTRNETLFFSGTSQQDLYLTEVNRQYTLSLSVGSGNFDGSASKPLYLFCLNNIGSVTANAFVKLYSFEVWNGDALVCDLVPCRRNSDGAVGMYDRVTDSFFGNAGTGEFIAGETEGAV